MMARFLRTMAEYDGGVERNIEQEREQEESGKKKKVGDHHCSWQRIY